MDKETTKLMKDILDLINKSECDPWRVHHVVVTLANELSEKLEEIDLT